jgi:ribose 5-phosphate isomerase B
VKILIASDHAGFELKKQVVEALKAEMSIEDLGPFSTDSVDYPDYANLVCRKIEPINTTDTHLSTFGVLICGSGQGMALRANKFSYIRAALVYNDEITKLSREHNDANIICIGSRFTDLETTLRWIRLFKETQFIGGRHQTRVAKVSTPVT